MTIALYHDRHAVHFKESPEILDALPGKIDDLMLASDWRLDEGRWRAGEERRKREVHTRPFARLPRREPLVSIAYLNTIADCLDLPSPVALAHRLGLRVVLTPEQLDALATLAADVANRAEPMAHRAWSRAEAPKRDWWRDTIQQWVVAGDVKTLLGREYGAAYVAVMFAARLMGLVP